MIYHINGKLIEKKPTEVIIECNGVGYHIFISLNTFSALPSSENLKLYTKLIVREDAQLLYGFINTDERLIFEQLIAVSGIGPNTAMIMLSSLQPEEIARAIQHEDVQTIQSVKGIGAKTAQRVIIDLKDKMIKLNLSEENFITQGNTNQNDALNALISLGFDKKKAERVIEKVAKADDKVEQIIKEALKIL